MDLVARTLGWQRALLCLLLGAAALGFWRAGYDVFNTFKATVIVLGAIGIALVGAYRVARTRRVVVPRSPVVVAAAVLAAAFVVATAVSPLPMASVVGRPGRHTGLALYLTYLGLFVVATRLYRDHAPTALAKTLLGVAAPVTIYGLLQAAGVDPYGWQAVEGGPQVFSTFGNANFFAAFLGVVIPLAVWGALTATWAGPWRVASGALAVAAFAATVVSHSQQGPAMALAGSALVLGVALATSATLPRRTKAAVFAGAAALAVVAAGALIAGAGPFAGLRAGLARSLATRTPKWETALAIFRDHPIAGVGLERFADHFHEYRPVGLAAATGLRRTTDTPHDIPLDMLANGGLLLALAYLAFVGLTGWALVVGLRRNSGEDRLLLAGFGGGWLAYQVQSLVSIDVPPVAVLHYVLAGVVVALGTRPALATLTLPGARPVPAARPAGKGRRARPARLPLVPANPVVLGLLALAGVAGVVLATTPLRADVAAGSAVRLGAAQPQAAIAAYRRASDIAFWESRYPGQLGSFLASREVGRPQDALAAYREAVARDPRSLGHALSLARLEAASGDAEAADAAWERVLAIDPKTPEVLAQAGDHWLRRGDLDRAAELVQRAVRVDEEDAALWVALGEVKAAERDMDAARRAFERALQLNPEVEGGAEGLARVDGVA